jgi:hypothetical protein
MAADSVTLTSSRARLRSGIVPKRLRLALEHAVLVVEAVEVIGHADRVGRQPVRATPLDRLLDDARELDEPLDQLPLLGGEPFRT